MSDARLAGPPGIQRKLADFSRRPLNFDLAALASASPANGWTTTDLCQPLPTEPPGEPVEGGSWEIARRLMSGYEFADPSIVHAYYDPDTPLQDRTMLLRLKALGVLHLDVGVRVGDVYDSKIERDGRGVRVWGWNYRTLEGHVEVGQMAWEVWKWLDDGRVEFRVHSVSRAARISNPVIRLGFRLLRGHERAVFLETTKRRMLKFTEVALAQADPGAAIRDAAADAKARPARDTGAADEALVRRLPRA